MKHRGADDVGPEDGGYLYLHQSAGLVAHWGQENDGLSLERSEDWGGMIYRKLQGVLPGEDLIRYRDNGHAEWRVCFHVRECMYRPAVNVRKVTRGFAIGPYLALFSADLENLGEVTYLYVLVIYPHEGKTPVLFVASEDNLMAQTLGGGSHFLGMFDEQGHHNCGSSDEWADAETFLTQALEMARERLNVHEAVRELPPPKR